MELPPHLIHTVRFLFLDGALKEVIGKAGVCPGHTIQAMHPAALPGDPPCVGRLLGCMVGLDEGGAPASRSYVYREVEDVPRKSDESCA